MKKLILFICIVVMISFASVALAHTDSEWPDGPDRSPDKVAFKSNPVDILAEIIYEVPSDYAAHLFWQASHNAICLCGLHSDQTTSLTGIDLNTETALTPMGTALILIHQPLGMYRVLKCPIYKDIAV